MSPPPPPPRMGGPNQYQHQPPSYGQNSYGQQQGPPQNQPYAPPSSGHPNHYGSQPMQSQPGFGQPPQNQYGQSQNIVSQNPYGSAQQQSGGVPGLPPPSNSYGMPPQNQPTYMNQQQQPSYSNAPYSPPQAQQNRFSQPGAPPNQWGNQAPPHSPAPPMDILALADKASSAVQALQNQNKFSYQQPPPYQQRPPYGQQPPPMNPQMSYPPGNQPYQSQQAYMGSNSGPAQKKRRTTATIVELPTNVQFAVQVRLSEQLALTYGWSFLTLAYRSVPCRICKQRVKPVPWTKGCLGWSKTYQKILHYNLSKNLLRWIRAPCAIPRPISQVSFVESWKKSTVVE